MTNQQDEALVISPDLPPTAAIIWLHGLGADGDDFVGLPEQMGFTAQHPLKFIFPQAPWRPVTINNGMIMRSWYDVYDLNMLAKEDKAGIQQSQSIVSQLVQQEIAAGIPSQRIIVGGFSQGGALALYTGLRSSRQLAGIITLSGYQPLHSSLADERCVANNQTPIMLAHGLFDPIVPFNLGQLAMEQLTALDYQVSWHSYPMQHTLVADEIADIASFINKVFSL